jgi:PBSX family phage terminase large subunit
MARRDAGITTDTMVQMYEATFGQMPYHFRNLSYEPMDKQLDFHKSDCKIRLYIGGNRSGKSYGSVAECIWWALGNHPYRSTPRPPIMGRVVGVDFPNGCEKILFPIFKKLCPEEGLAGGNWDRAYSKGTRVLTFKNGSTIEFMSADQAVDKFAGSSRHFCYFDEEPPKSVYTECQARLVDTDGDSWISMTPVLGITWMYDDLYKNDDVFKINSSTLENRYLSTDAIGRFMKTLDSDTDVDIRIYGKFVALSGLIFNMFDPNVHIIKVSDFHPKPPLQIYVGMDFGIHNPNAFLWNAIFPSGEIVTFFEVYESEKTIPEMVEIINATNKKLGLRPDLYIGDPAARNRSPITGTSIQEEYSVRGIPVGLSSNDVRVGIARTQEYMKAEKWKCTDNCVNLISEIQRYQWKRWITTKVEERSNPQDTPMKKMDHAVDALRYMIMALPEYANFIKPVSQDEQLRRDVDKMPYELRGRKHYSSMDETWAAAIKSNWNKRRVSDYF